MKHQDAQSRDDTNVTREAKMVLSPDNPMAKAKRRPVRTTSQRRNIAARQSLTSCQAVLRRRFSSLGRQIRFRSLPRQLRLALATGLKRSSQRLPNAM
jgi:hypothetical protein